MQTEYTVAWKVNWEETKQHFLDWWKRDGMVLCLSGLSSEVPHEEVPHPGFTIEGYGDEEFAADPVRQRDYGHYQLSRRAFPADALPLADFSLGPGTHSVYLGATPVFDKNTVW